MLILLKAPLALTMNYFSVASFPSDVLGSFTRIFNKGFGSKEGKPQVCSEISASGAGTKGQWDNDDSFVNNFVTTFTQNIRRIQTFSCASYAFIYCSIFLFLDPIGSLVLTFVIVGR